MPDDRVRLEALARGQTTVAGKIRALAAAGVPRADIARFLGKRYQHIRNVLQDDAQRGGGRYVLGQADLSGVKEPAAPYVAGADDPYLIERRRPGVYWLRPRPDGSLVLPHEVAEKLGLTEGYRVFAELDGEELKIISGDEAMRQARELVCRIIPPEVDLASELLSDRQAEVAREAEQDG
jgi:hypothetical protein